MVIWTWKQKQQICQPQDSDSDSGSRQKRPRNVKQSNHKAWISVRWLQIWRLTGIHLPYKLFILLGRKSEGDGPLIPPSFPSPSPNPHRLVQGTHDSRVSSICLPHTGPRLWCSFLRIQHFQYVFLTNTVFFLNFFSENPGCYFERTKCGWKGDEEWQLSWNSSKKICSHDRFRAKNHGKMCENSQ